MTDPSAILKLDQARRNAIIGADVPTLEAMLADNMVWIHGNARLDTKEGLLGLMGSGETKFLAIECTDETVRFFGDLAVLTAAATMKAEVSGRVRDVRSRYTIVWAPVGDDWKVVNYQTTFVPETV